MKVNELIHRGLYILGESEVVYFYVLNGHFYSRDNRCLGCIFEDAESGEISCLVGGNNWMEVKPIPLTPEILEKNGFETKFGYSKYNDEDDFFLITWNEISHHLRIRTFDNDCALDKDHIDYVHELQHALRLCGLNDLADNFKV